ncbi:AAA family ATPase [Alkalihalobacillus pseudalcaliphilus]|uniref:AAA family ATPase n=1 Tax=Alkalihalobacillus pseudalcaliphilus TaxID=79884 RepID=UPI00064DD7B7|nr:AAA family ATPase [Alkalihalobacillus pseudalcaliphilus]
MKKLKLVIADQDSTYLSSFGEYIISSKAAAQFDVKFFSSSESVQKYVDQGNHIDLLILNEHMKNVLEENMKHGVLVTLVEDKKNANDDEANVFKYQPLNQVISEILSIYFEHHQAEHHGGGSLKTKVLAVYSPVGGSGKTTFAVNVSRQLALNNKKVFYLNLELLNSTKLYFSSKEDKPSLQIFYYVKAKPKELRSKIEKLKKFDQKSKVDYFDLLPSPIELQEISENETKVLITALVETEQYDYIVIDLDSSITNLTKAAMESADQVIWMMNNDLQSFHKTRVLFDSFDDLFGVGNGMEEQTTLIMNRFNGQLQESFQAYHLPIRGYLPNVPSWAQVADTEQIYFDPHYNQELITITKGLIEQEREGVKIG